jgi:hypothetical protein
VVFRFQKASCVVVGTFNIHILHPQWLARRGIIQQGLEIGVETNLTRPGIRLRFPEHGALWSISPDRLVIETDDAVFDCGQLAAHVLRILPETPVFGLGNNLHCVADPGEAGNLPRVLREFPEADGGSPPLETVQRTLHWAFSRGEHETINLQLAMKDEEIELLSNVHYGTGASDEPNVATVAAAERFFADCVESMRLAERAFGVIIHHDSDNA